VLKFIELWKIRVWQPFIVYHDTLKLLKIILSLRSLFLRFFFEHFKSHKKRTGEYFKNWVRSFCTISSRCHVMSHFDWVMLLFRKFVSKKFRFFTMFVINFWKSILFYLVSHFINWKPNHKKGIDYITFKSF
jgi:hypothetical protein